jgi:predicted nucleic acid-binding Zn ribbon protein
LELIKKAIEESAAGMGLKAVVETSRLIDLWAEIAGEPLAAKSEPVLITGRTLVVATTGPAWSHQLSMLKTQLLEKVRGQGFDLDELRFTALAKTKKKDSPKPEKESTPADFSAIPPEIGPRELRKAIASFLGARGQAKHRKAPLDMIK